MQWNERAKARCLIYALSTTKLFIGSALWGLALVTPLGWHRLVFKAPGAWWYSITWAVLFAAYYAMGQGIQSGHLNLTWLWLCVPHYVLWAADGLGLWPLVHKHTLRRHSWRLEDQPAAMEV